MGTIIETNRYLRARKWLKRGARKNRIVSRLCIFEKECVFTYSHKHDLPSKHFHLQFIQYLYLSVWGDSESFGVTICIRETYERV